MKIKPFVIAIGLVLGISALFFAFPNQENQTPRISQQAGYVPISCTTAKFLLKDVDTTQPIAPLFKNLGNHSFPISTKNPEAQAFFDQGLRLTYAFNHAEAHRAFLEAARLDPKAAMAHWGQAYALGPNINDPFPDDERKQKAYEALENAQKLSPNASAREQGLINALASRYSANLSTEGAELNEAYHKAMTPVVEKFSSDADIQTLYAAAIMNTMPWNYWDNDGQPSPHTLDAKAALEQAIALNPNHPGAHHYYIHMMELPNPHTAEASADRLGNLMPAAGHLVHMPAHIYIRIGRYKDAVSVNQKAILADEDYISQCYAQGMYPLAYYPHNLHFLWSAASLIGESETAIAAATKTAEKVPIGDLETLHFLQDFASTPMLAYTRFGKWNEILTIPYPGDQYKHLKLIWHYSRGIAFSRKGNLKDAKEELDAIANMKKDPELKDIIANYTNPTAAIAPVAEAVLAGEIAASEQDYTAAISHLQEAVALEGQLVYSEPAAWHVPCRQSLGAVLLLNEEYEKAEQIYREDLKRLPDNGWSLMGLYQSLKGQGKTTEAATVKSQFDEVWQYADITIETSVL